MKNSVVKKFIFIFNICVLLFLQSNSSFCEILKNEFISVSAKKGSGILDLLDKYKLTKSDQNIQLFTKINSDLLDKNGGLLLNQTYILPIQIANFDGKTIRSSLKINDFQLAKKIESYNFLVEKAKIKSGNFKKTKELWIPTEILIIDSNFFKNINLKNTKAEKNAEKLDYSYLLSNENIKLKNKKLAGSAFYIIVGHGGADPGAVGFRDGFELHEHEYAYDVSVRFAKALLESGAEVYMIVQDEKDGIRENEFLKNGGNEKLINGENISPIQLERLKQRTDIVNNYVKQNGKKFKNQALIEIHVDSRITDKRIDIFFYHRPNCPKSQKLNNTLLKTIKSKYEKAQPGRGYAGTVSARDLFTLRNTTIDAAYIELGNIQNPADQIRLIQPNNRQAIANWLYDGIVKHYRK
jgi:N-acetylmuramoyl-L-alanine amidase